MAAKPFIGVNFDGPCDRFSQGTLSAPQLPRWLDCINQCGGIPLLVPSLRDLDDVSAILDILDGFVFAGQTTSKTGVAMESRKDLTERWEARMLGLIAEHRLPFLGLGRGMQLLNLALGGRLANGPVGRSSPGSAHVPRRPLSTQPDSLMAAIFDAHAVPVSSVHESTIAQVAVGLRATAWTDDGLVEAVESESGDWFAVGVQFLPEADSLEDTDLRLFGALVDEAVAARDRSAAEASAPRELAPSVQPFAAFAEPLPRPR